MPTVFSEPVGQGWTQMLELLVAFVLALLIGIERESHQRSAGIRTYTLVGLGSALFVLISKYGFNDVLGEHIVLDPSRVAAQIVRGSATSTVEGCCARSSTWRPLAASPSRT